MDTQGERLREERERLGFNQTDFAKLCGLTKLTQLNYEQNKRAPDGVYLATIAKVGADVLYIITGQRSGELLPSREAVLLDNYRHSDEKGKRVIEQTALVVAEPSKEYKKKDAG